jgi:hypothetical protein
MPAGQRLAAEVLALGGSGTWARREQGQGPLGDPRRPFLPLGSDQVWLIGD